MILRSTSSSSSSIFPNILKYLDSTVEPVDHRNSSLVCKKYSWGMFELHIRRPFFSKTREKPQCRSKYLHAMVLKVPDNNIAFTITGYSRWPVEFTVGWSFRSNWVKKQSLRINDYHSIIPWISYHVRAIVFYYDMSRWVELTNLASVWTNHKKGISIGCKHLHPVIITLCHNYRSIFING